MKNLYRYLYTFQTFLIVPNDLRIISQIKFVKQRKIEENKKIRRTIDRDNFLQVEPDIEIKNTTTIAETNIPCK